MAESFHVELVTAEESVLSVDATEVYARSLDGEIGILPGHQPVLLALDIAPLKVVRADGGVERIACHHGFLYFHGGELVILADTAEIASQIDVDRARRRRQELEERRGDEADEADEDVERAIRRQDVRLDVAEKA